MKLLAVQVAVVSAMILSGCGGQNGIPLNGPPPLGPSLSWTAGFAQGLQAGTIAFQSLGQTATLNAAAQPNGAQPPYQDAVESSCVTLSSSSVGTSVQVTAVASGTCIIRVGGSTIQASVP